MLRPIIRRTRLFSHRPLQHIISKSMSSQQPAAVPPKQVSPHVGFYRTFGRPVAKVLLMATFTYQLSYWLWVKLEKDEIIATRQAEISALEAELREVVASTKRT